ncbi:MAG: carboxymuconolactone decarboxylase family protein [Planctomycetota bacterium]|jgi:uncharacterized peroxidase-related enzyme
MLRDDEHPRIVMKVMEDWERAGLDERRAALCRYAVKATRTPAEMTKADLAPLRAEGLTDEDLLTLVHVISFFNGVNRVADCLHVDPEQD